MVNANQEAAGSNFSVFDLTRPGIRTPRPSTLGASAVATLSVIKSLNVIIITHRCENATLSVIKLNFITKRGAIATRSVIHLESLLQPYM